MARRLGATALLLLHAMASMRGVAAQANGPGFYKISTKEEIKQSAKDLAWHVMTLYPGNKTGNEVGIFPGPPSEGKGPYYWWQAGAVWGAMIDYWHYTGDSTYNSLVTDGIIHQIGEDQDFEPKRHRASLGNDDQGFWGMTAMLAAENKFPDAPGAGSTVPGWLALAQAVWVRQTLPERQDSECGGGLRWQVPGAGWGPGQTYKNTIANAAYFNIGARLTRYTGNETYAQHAEKIWDWMWARGYIDHESWRVYDGAYSSDNCTEINRVQYMYNPGILIQGAAAMYDHTKKDKWKKIVSNLTTATIESFFSDGAALEASCEPHGLKNCSSDMVMFKGFVHRWMAQTTLLAPFVKDEIRPVLRKSAAQALKTCTGAPTGRACGYFWTKGEFVDPALTEDTLGVGTRLDVLSAVMSLLVEFDDAQSPTTGNTGGNSAGDTGAGLRHTPTITFSDITAGDRAGAGILTTVIIGLALGMFGWISWERPE